jgi:hypothetical protein
MYVGLHHLVQILYCNQTLCVCVCVCVHVCTCSQDLKLAVKQTSELLSPSSFRSSKLKTSQPVAYFRCRFSFVYAIANYGCYYSCYSYSIKVKKEEVTSTQEHKKPTSKRNQKNSKLRKIYHFQH